MASKVAPTPVPLKSVRPKRELSAASKATLKRAQKADLPWRRLALDGQHPLRFIVLQHVTEHEEATAGQMADALGEPLGNISHHVRSLAQDGALVKAREVRVRGTIATYWRRSKNYR